MLTRRAYILLFLAAVLSRLLVSTITMVAYHIPLSRYSDKGDGESYKRYALVIRGKPTTFTHYDTRVFPGYPLLIAAADCVGVLPEVSSLLITFLCAGVAAVAAAKLFEDMRIGWAMVFLIPHYVINSSLSMSEAPMLAFTLCGVLLAVRSDQDVLGGLLMGMAGLIRPVAAFAALGYLFYRWRRNESRSAVTFALMAGMVIVLGLLGLHLAFGDAMHGVRAYASEPGAYNGNIFTWPFGSLILTPLQHPEQRAKIPYIAIHVLVTFLGCGLLWRRKDSSGGLSALAAVWLTANTAFVLCIGNKWGYQHFPRFMIPAQACLFLAYQRCLPRKSFIWCSLAALTMTLAVFGAASSP